VQTLVRRQLHLPQLPGITQLQQDIGIPTGLPDWESGKQRCGFGMGREEAEQCKT
jgi:hypothetical protein